VITLSRMRWDARTRAYVTRRTAEGKSKLEIIRCLKRFIAREIYQILATPLPPVAPRRHPPRGAVDPGAAPLRV
jgi:transposase